MDDFSYVELTPSQRKIEYPSLASGVLPDPAHRIIDILRSSHVRTPCRLSVETIINLLENGVPKSVFLNLLHQGLEELVEPLLEWDGPDAMRNLWCRVCRVGGVMSARRAREEPGLARVKGYLYTEHGPEEDDSEDEDEIFDTTVTEEEKSSAWWRDEISGCPCLGSMTNHRLNYRNNDDEGLVTQVTQRKGLEMQPEEPCMFFFTFFFAYTNVYLQINTCRLYLCHSTTVFPNRRDDDESMTTLTRDRLETQMRSRPQVYLYIYIND